MASDAAAAKPDLAAMASQLAALATLPETVKALEGRFSDMGRQVAKVRGVKKQEPNGDEGGGVATSPPIVTQEDLHAALRLGRVLATLPDEGAAYVEELQSQGISVAEALRVASAMQLMIKKAPATGASVPGGAMPPAHLNGVAATAASRTDPLQVPRTQTEYAALIRKDPSAGEKIRLLDPNFSAWTLPR